MEWVFDDGGREEAGFKGSTRDCVCRAVAIAAERPYKEVYDLINEYAQSERKCKHKKSNARTGVRKTTMKKVLEHYGFAWVPTMQVGSGCKVHLKSDELPSGRIVCSVSGHAVAVVNGVLHDTYDSSRDESRCVYGYFFKPGTDVAEKKTDTKTESTKKKKEATKEKTNKEKTKTENNNMAEGIRTEAIKLKSKITPADYPDAIKAINGLAEDFERNAKNNQALFNLRGDKECYWRAFVWNEGAKTLREVIEEFEDTV